MGQHDGDAFPNRISTPETFLSGAARPAEAATGGRQIVGPGMARKAAPGALMLILTLLIFTEGRLKRWVLASIGGGFVTTWLIDRGD